MIDTKTRIRFKKFWGKDIPDWKKHLHQAVDGIKDPENLEEVHYNLTITFIKGVPDGELYKNER